MGHRRERAAAAARRLRHLRGVPRPSGGNGGRSPRASAAYDAANAARKDLEKTLKAQFGNKRDKWPVDAQERLLDAEDAVARANTDWVYRTHAEPVNAFWRDAIATAMTRSGRTGRKEHITSVSSTTVAHLILTITGVRTDIYVPTIVVRTREHSAFYDRCVTVRLERGPKLSAAQFSAAPRTYRAPRSKVTRLAAPDAGSPFWRFEGCGIDVYSSTEEAIANIANDFVEAHRHTLTGATRQ